MPSWWRRLYGAGPLHLLVLLGCFSVVGYATVQIETDPNLPRILIWFAAAVIIHDLVAYPLYSLLDRVAHGVLARLRAPRISPLNYLRVPALASALLFGVYFPGIVRQGGPSLHAASGQSQHPYLGRWLMLTAIAFAVSGLAYVARLIRTRRR
jgi:hypothetical protein